jgi:hypothetical protein
MGDYQPFDLTSWCNVGAQWVAQDGDLPLGNQTLRGLPFQIGPAFSPESSPPEETGEPCFLGFGPDGYGKAVEIPLDRTVRWLIIAHRLLESRIREGEPVGHLIATYRLRYADGQEIALPIRERLEIAVVPTNWGHLPLLAVPDCFDDVPARQSGRWEQVGWRLTEIGQAYPRWFYLWAWQNPHPEKALAALRIGPQDRQFLVAALTLSTLDEDPFGRQPRRPVKITLRDLKQAEESFNLGVTVDRGATTYPYPLPDEPMEGFLADGFRGWGQAYHNRNSPAYVEISALPSATVQVKLGETEVAALTWGDLLTHQETQNEQVRVELVDRGKNWVHVTVVDDETGKPVPCRVHFRSPEGIPYQPHGHHDHLLSDMDTWHIDVGGDVRLGHMTYAYIDGHCQGWLPRGQVLVDVARGFEYEPLRTAVTIQPGQRELTLRLRRWTDQNAQRWFSGDSHVHFLSTQGAHLEAQGEDLNVVNLLQSQWGHLFTNTEDFLGRPVPSDDGRTVVYTSQENRQHMLGHLILLGLKEPVMPWCSDGPSEAEIGGTLETTLSHWADACHAQGGTVIIPHLPPPNGEPATLIATGRADAVEMLWHGMYNHTEYYRYLNGGYQLPLVGGTDKMTADVPVGLYRTYVYIPPDQPFTYDTWCQNLRSGRTFLSGGPILRFTVDGAMVGDTIKLPGNGGTVEVEAEAESILPIHTLEIVQAGQVVAATQEPVGARRLHLKTHLSIDRHSWLAARVGGPEYGQPLSHHDGWGRGVMAHTSPIYIAVGEDWWMANQETAQYMLTLVHGSIEYIRQRSRQHVPGTVTHHHGQVDHLAYLEQPFHEALEAIQKKLHQPR